MEIDWFEAIREGNSIGVKYAADNKLDLFSGDERANPILFKCKAGVCVYVNFKRCETKHLLSL